MYILVEIHQILALRENSPNMEFFLVRVLRRFTEYGMAATSRVKQHV